jgi:DNA repair protein RadA/Sms
MFQCPNCKHQSKTMLMRCPQCGAFGRFDAISKGMIHSPMGEQAQPVRLSTVQTRNFKRVSTGEPEFDHAIGGGLVDDMSILLAAPPGMGKSTAASSLSASLARRAMTVLYVPGEESPEQVRLRTDRIGATHDNVIVLGTSDVDRVCRELQGMRPDFLVIDSIQSMADRAINSGAGSTHQVKQCAHRLVNLCKELGIPHLLIAHVTKDDDLAGPRTLEHLVDTFLYLDGDRNTPYRFLRAPKNRFGGPGRVGMFEMTDSGLKSLTPAASIERARQARTMDVCGSVYTPIFCGDRPSIVEIQALVCDPVGNTGKKVIEGISSTRVNIILGVLQKHAGIHLAGHDLIVKVVGGMRVDDPLVDLAVAAAITSSAVDTPFPEDVAIFGEVGLTGEIMRHQGGGTIDSRLRVAREMGFQTSLGPHNVPDIKSAMSWESFLEEIGKTSEAD